MSLNWQEIDLVLSEWQLEGAMVQNIVQPDFSQLYLEFYQPGRISWLLVSLQAGLTRLHLMEAPPRTKTVQPRFAEFLRARIKGGRITGYRQLGGERIVEMDIATEDGPVRLYFRLWSNAANIIATDADNAILDAFYRRPHKGETSGGNLVLPTIRETGPAERDRFPVRSWPGPASGSGFNQWLYANYRVRARELDFNVQKERLLRQAIAAIVRLEGRETTLLRQTRQNANPERLRQLGEILMAFKQQIRRGAEWFETEDWYNPGTTLRIELDPKLDPVGNAERYFQRYQKARDGQRYLEEDLAQVRANLTKVRALEEGLRSADDLEALNGLGASLEVYLDTGAGKKAGLESSRPGLSFESAGFPIFIGRTAAENDELLRRHVRGNDYWLHVRDLPGGYVFIKVPKTKSVPLEVLLDAAHLAIWYSRAKNEPEADLFYTQVKYLRRAKHGTYGMVIPTRERNLHIRVDTERQARLMGNLNPEG